MLLQVFTAGVIADVPGNFEGPSADPAERSLPTSPPLDYSVRGYVLRDASYPDLPNLDPVIVRFNTGGMLVADPEAWVWIFQEPVTMVLRVDRWRALGTNAVGLSASIPLAAPP